MWLNNLFISVKLLRRLRELRVKVARIVRITRTQNEE